MFVLQKKTYQIITREGKNILKAKGKFNDNLLLMEVAHLYRRLIFYRFQFTTTFDDQIWDPRIM